MADGKLGPSERDIRIYVAHKVEGKTTRWCGKKFGVAHSTIIRVCRAVQPYVVRQLLAEAPDRLTLKLEQHARLERIWQEANRGWRKSLKDAEKQTLKEGGKFGDSVEHSREGQSGDSAFLTRMVDAVKGIRELWGLDDPKPDDNPAKATGVFINVNGADRVDVAAVDMRAELLRERDYLEFQRQRALEIDTDSSPIRADSEPGPMEDGAAPNSPGPLGGGSGNGQANGHHH